MKHLTRAKADAGCGDAIERLPALAQPEVWRELACFSLPWRPHLRATRWPISYRSDRKAVAGPSYRPRVVLPPHRHIPSRIFGSRSAQDTAQNERPVLRRARDEARVEPIER